MTYYYLNSAGQNVGPLNIENLKAHGITRDTLVRAQGMPDWTKAGDLYELAGLFAPPPLNSSGKMTPKKKLLFVAGAFGIAVVGLIVLRFITPLSASLFNANISTTMIWVWGGLLFVLGMILVYILKSRFCRIATAVFTLVFVAGYCSVMYKLFEPYLSYRGGFAASWYSANYPHIDVAGNYIIDNQGNVLYEYSKEIKGINRWGMPATEEKYFYSEKTPDYFKHR